EILSLQIERAEITHARADADAAAQIASLEAAYEAARTADEEQPLYASISGVVDSVVNLEPGAAIDASRAIVTLYNPEKVLIRAENASGALQYGMAVDVRLTGYAGQSTTTGVVVAADNVLPGEARSGYAYIAYEAPARGDFHSATVTAVTMRAEDALIAPMRAISLRDGLCTVTILDADGTLRTRHVVKAMDDGAQAWLWMGVHEGDKLITK
ncbi:MAG: efflux RND transporter periplasmic adaptor subunit, partial [Christensenellales bacterium]